MSTDIKIQHRCDVCDRIEREFELKGDPSRIAFPNNSMYAFGPGHACAECYELVRGVLKNVGDLQKLKYAGKTHIEHPAPSTHGFGLAQIRAEGASTSGDNAATIISRGLPTKPSKKVA